MTEWVLVLAMWAGTFSSSDSVSVNTVVGFSSEARCDAAGKTAVKKFTTFKKTVDFFCIQK